MLRDERTVRWPIGMGVCPVNTRCGYCSTLHAIRQGLPLFINFIAEDLGSTADKAFLLGAFYPGYCVAMLPSGMVKGVGACWGATCWGRKA